ncbi:isoleucine biosynthesis transcriptional activator [Microtetraspora sp. NBRC 13810]|uniref:LysR family transcriptional regulator n=1 Tax=Microtetraspora sp. NBRC 13810 TaxID=3030990 RepID=UPI0024A52DAF|nr:LysR family transcriptional regulator [Microtetraspora sp. NBRC 13810]GLW07645.1 isoleucine biosynthesis transcriptional activator [Microtetraspora sp. NBRC 13810]
MNLRQMEYAVLLAEERHFGRAAQRAGVRQPPFSQQIRRLEEELGVVLFERNTRSVQITAAGEAFVAEARRSLAHAGRAAELARQAGRGEAGRLAVGFVGSAMNVTLPPVLRAFRARYPGVEVVLQELTSAQQIELLTAVGIDVGLIRGPVGWQAAQTVATRVVAREPMLAVLHAGHPLARLDPLPLARLRDEAFVLFPRRRGPMFHDLIVELAAGAGFEPRVVQEATRMQSIIGLVATGIGVSLVPGSEARLRRDDVVFRPLTPPGPPITLDLAWRRADSHPGVRNLRALFPVD